MIRIKLNLFLVTITKWCSLSVWRQQIWNTRHKVMPFRSDSTHNQMLSLTQSCWDILKIKSQDKNKFYFRKKKSFFRKIAWIQGKQHLTGFWTDMAAVSNWWHKHTVLTHIFLNLFLLHIESYIFIYCFRMKLIRKVRSHFQSIDKRTKVLKSIGEITGKFSSNRK